MKRECAIYLHRICTFQQKLQIHLSILYGLPTFFVSHPTRFFLLTQLFPDLYDDRSIVHRMGFGCIQNGTYWTQNGNLLDTKWYSF